MILHWEVTCCLVHTARDVAQLHRKLIAATQMFNSLI